MNNHYVQTEKLNFWTKLAYGAGDLGPAICANIQVFSYYISLLMLLAYLLVSQVVF